MAGCDPRDRRLSRHLSVLWHCFAAAASPVPVERPVMHLPRHAARSAEPLSFPGGNAQNSAAGGVMILHLKGCYTNLMHLIIGIAVRLRHSHCHISCRVAPGWGPGQLVEMRIDMILGAIQRACSHFQVVGSLWMRLSTSLIVRKTVSNQGGLRVVYGKCQDRSTRAFGLCR